MAAVGLIGLQHVLFLDLGSPTVRVFVVPRHTATRPECQPSGNYFSSSWSLRLLRTWCQLCAWNPMSGDPNLPETMNTGAVDTLMTTMQRPPRRPVAHAAASNCCHWAYGTYYRRQFWTRPLPSDLGSGNMIQPFCRSALVIKSGTMRDDNLADRLLAILQDTWCAVYVNSCT